MKISKQEQKAIRSVIELGEQFGYGNMIAHLQTAWARMLIDNHGIDEKLARRASGGIGYPFAMQDDLIEVGEWDETGKRYIAKVKP